MRFRGDDMILRVPFVCLFLLASAVSVLPQQNISVSRKFDEWGNLMADDEEARLDEFAAELNKNSNSVGYIIGYNEARIPPGLFLRRIYGYWDYLVKARGINPNLIKVVEGGNRAKRITELWLMPNGASPPKPSSELRLNLKSPLKFDEVLVGVGCEPEFTLDLYELDDGLKFYAKVLRENPNSKAWIITYPNRHARMSRAANLAKRTKNLLVSNFNIKPNRIATRISRRRPACMKAEIWIVPAGASFSRIK